MKMRSTFAVAAISLAAWAVPAMATPPSAVYYDRSPRHEDPWSDRQDQRSGPQRGQQQHGGRAPSKEADDDSDEKETIKQLAKQVKELTKQVKELNEKLEESETPHGGKAARGSGRESEDRQQDREDGPGQMGRGHMGSEQSGRGQMGPGRAGFGRMGPMGGGPGGRGMGGGMMGRGRPGMGGDDGEGNRFFGPMTRQPAKAEKLDSAKPVKKADREDDDQPAHKMVTIRAKKIGDGEVEEKTLVITSDKMPKLPDGLKIEPGDKIIIIRAKGDDDADEKPSVKAKKQIKEDQDTDDDQPAKREQARPRGRRGE